MTADEYKEMHEKTKKFEELSDYLQALITGNHSVSTV